MTTWGAAGMIAEKLDLFRKAGTDVNVNQFGLPGVAVRDAMVAGRIDIGVAAVSSFIIGVDKGQLPRSRRSHILAGQTALWSRTIRRSAVSPI